MRSKKPMFTLRTEQKYLDMLHMIAVEEKRSDNKQLEYILLKYIEEYEYEYGTLQIQKK